MPAYTQRRTNVRPRERAVALAAVVLVQTVLILALVSGLHVSVTRAGDAVQRLVQVTLSNPPPPPPPTVEPRPKPGASSEDAPKAAPLPIGGSPGPAPTHAPPSVTPIVAVQPTAAPSGGGTGSGPATGQGAGGGTGGNGFGEGDDGGSELEQIAGAITPKDFPKHLREAGIGGRVFFVFTVESNGRVSRCSITRSSGVPELDALTCRLVQQRFVYRPSTDRYGRPIADEVEGDHLWVSRGR
ncbi:MAG TPA: TonB family protein [Sphingomicrobium sp.]